MELNDLPEVSGIGGDGDYKFLIVDIFDKSLQNHRRILRAGLVDMAVKPDERLLHIDIHQMISAEHGKDIRHMNRGGGWPELREKRSRIVVSRSSRDYGREPDRDETLNMIRRAFPISEVVARD